MVCVKSMADSGLIWGATAYSQVIKRYPKRSQVTKYFVVVGTLTMSQVLFLVSRIVWFSMTLVHPGFLCNVSTNLAILGFCNAVKEVKLTS